MDKDELIHTLGEALIMSQKAGSRSSPRTIQAVNKYLKYSEDQDSLAQADIDSSTIIYDELRTAKHQKSFPHRFFVHCETLGRPYASGHADPPCAAEKANLMISATNDGYHAPALDIDYNAHLVPSRTKGHFHLYLDKKLSWETYKELLQALAKAGIIEDGYANASIARGYSALRWQWAMTQEGREVMIQELKEILNG